MIYLDTHVVVWLYEHRHEKLSRTALRLLQREPGWISPIVMLELEILYERERLPVDPDTLRCGLENSVGLSVSEPTMAHVIKAARTFAWTRDPFDRLIVANAMADGARLLTADETIRRHFKDAIW